MSVYNKLLREKPYREQGLEGLYLSHKGSSGYLRKLQREDVIKWLQEKTQRNLLV